MDIRQMRYFAEVVEKRSFSRAAESLNLSQPALSKSIRLLESGLNVKLLERTSNGVRPTLFGESLYVHAKSIKAELVRARAEIEALNGATEEFVSVGVLPSQAVGIIPEASINLTRSKPGIRVQIVEKPRVDIIPALRRGEFDFAVSVVNDQDTEPGITQRKMFQDRPSIIVRSSHPVLNSGALNVMDLLEYQWILPRDGADHRIHMEEYFRSQGSQLPSAVIESQSVPYLKSVVMQSDYIGILPNDTESVEEREGLLQRLDLEGHPRRRTIGILHRDDHPLSAASRYFVREIAKASDTGISN